MENKMENKKELLNKIDKILGNSLFYYEWIRYKSHDKLYISLVVLDGEISNLYMNLKELNLDFKIKINKPSFFDINEVKIYFENKNKHLSESILYMNGVWKMWKILKYKGVLIINEDNLYLLKHIYSWHNIVLEIKFFK